MKSVDNTTFFHRTTRNIAFYLLGLFGLFLIILLILHFIDDDNIQNGKNIWFDLFRSGFLFLSGALTTIIGYYFGNKNVAEAEKQAVESRQRVEELEVRIKNMEIDNSPTIEEMDLETPETLD